MKLDARTPLIVLVGDFNPSIFTTFWIAKNLHGYVEGDTLETLQIGVEVAPDVVQHLEFIKDVALVVTPSRVEAYVLDHLDAGLAQLSQVVGKIVEMLPHTPLRALGCNFSFLDEQPDDRLVAMFDSPEGIEGEGPVRIRTFVTKLDVDGVTLNLTRKYAGGPVQFLLNYHQNMSETEQFGQAIPSLVSRRKDHALGLMARLYGEDSHDTITFAHADRPENMHAVHDQGALPQTGDDHGLE